MKTDIFNDRFLKNAHWIVKRYKSGHYYINRMIDGVLQHKYTRIRVGDMLNIVVG
jgi:hypothetical protein